MKETFSLVKKTFEYYGKILGWMIFCAFIGLSRMLVMLLEPQIISLMVDRVIKPALGSEPVENSSIFSFLIKDIPPTNLWAIMGVLIIAFVTLMAFYFITFYSRWNIIHYVSIKIENSMRTDLVRKINDFGPGILKHYTNGELITIVNSDSSKIRNTYVAIVPFILDNLFYIVMAAYFLARTSILLMIFPMITFIAYLFITKGFIKKCGAFYDNMWKMNSSLNTEAQESIYGIRTIKAYAREKHRYKRFAKKSEEVKDFYVDFARTRFKYFFFYDSMDQILMLITMAVSIYLASQLSMTSGEYASFLGYLLTMAGCFVDLIFLVGDTQDFKVAAKRLFGLKELKDEAKEKYGDEKVTAAPHIVFNNVTAEADEKILIKNVSVDIPYGKKIGIMGKTGSGKSVFLKVMQGFTEYKDGNITIDDKDFYQYDKVEIARAYSYAMQDVFLFSNSISSNIAFYDPYGSQERIIECGKLAEVDEFACKFADGYETIVGEKGFGLSGGQKQRVAIARALYKDAPVIVLDDCTSALDVETESKIFANLKRACNEKTLLIATHRAPAIKDCDEILFFEDGSIVERGTFEELMKLNGKYAAIYNKQAGSEV